jgi:hypothetical protein
MAAVLIFSGTGAVLKAPTAHAAFPGGNGKIVFDTNGHIATVDPNGSNLHVFGAGSRPAWSADGSRIAFDKGNDIFVMNEDGTGETNITQNGSSSISNLKPAWSPDGSQIAFETSHAHGYEIWVMNSNGSGQHAVTHSGFDPPVTPATLDLSGFTGIDWSPDGSRILISAFRVLPACCSSDLYAITPDGSDQINITNTPGHQDAESAADWSPDGKRIVFIDSLGNVVVINADGSGRQNLTNGASPYFVSWSPDGSKIVYTSPNLMLFTMNSDGSDKTSLGMAGGNPDWQPAGGFSVEFTQAAQTLQSLSDLEASVDQDGNPPIPIVANKPAVMRIYFGTVNAATDYQVHTTLGNLGGSAEDANVHLEPGCSATQRRDLKNSCYSTDFYFVPPEGTWSTPVTISDSANHVVYTHDFHFTSTRSASLTIVTVPVCDFKLGAFWGCGDASAFDGLADLLRAVAPTDSVTVVHSPLSIYRETATADDAWWSGVMAQTSLLATANFLGLSGRVVWVGVVSDDLTSSTQGWTHFQRGLPIVGRDVSVVAMKSSTTAFGQANTDQALARYVASSLGLYYTDTAEPSTSSPPGCYAKALDNNTDWPFVTNSIYSTGFDVLSGNAKPKDKFLDLMGYCSPSWVSEHTYSGLLDKLKSGIFSSAVAPAAGDSWAVSGSITGQAATLEPLFTVDTPSSADAGTGAYRIEVRGSGGSVLFTRNFDATPSSPEPADGQQSVPGPAQFAELIGVQPGAERIVVLQGQTELGSIDLVGAAPTVTFDSQPSAGGQQTVSWTITDSDSTSFTSELDYSSDGGVTWQPIAVGLTDHELPVDFDKLAGSANAMLRVRVSDGANTGEATTGPFTVGEKGPQVSIVSPGDGALIHAGEVAALQAAASDAEDGTLTGGALSWSSSIDGALGTGASLPVANLSIGTHVITLTGHDSANHTATDTITLTVWDAVLIEGQANGDVNCDFSVSALDALFLLLKVAGTPRTQPSGCSDIGSGSPEFGDVDCGGSLDAPDVIGVLRFVVGRPLPPPSSCRPVGR